MTRKLSLSSYITVGSLLFGLFFGAGNLIFPVHMGQAAGSNTLPATLGFILTGVGLPFLGVVAIGISNSSGLFDLASRVSPSFALFFTVALYLTIGPFFALPRTATVSFEIGIKPFIPEEYLTVGLFVFTLIFFFLAWLLSLNPAKIMVWVGKVLNPLFLVFLALLIMTAFFNPMGTTANLPVQPEYAQGAFFQGFIEGYNTMDVLASLAFGIIIVNAIQQLGVTKPGDIAKDTIKSGIVTIILMSVIYGSLAFLGARSLNRFALSENGGIALTDITTYYFGEIGKVLLAIIVTVACLKTAIGLITACSETFAELFPSISYRKFVHVFSLLGMGIANVGLTSIIKISIPVLMFLYPLAITLVVITFLSPLYHHQKIVYQSAIGFTFIFAVLEGIKSLPAAISEHPVIHQVTQFIDSLLPFSAVQMGWILPAFIGLAVGWIISLATAEKITG